jgi:RHS repeat-associated protein
MRDALGRIEQLTETMIGTTSVYNYSYDTSGRLWQVMQDGVLSSAYLYDANGNRLSKTAASGTESGLYDDQDRIRSYGRWTFTQTPNGEVQTKTDTTSGAVTTYVYDGFGGLRRVALPGGRLVEYVIDGEGRRIAKKIDGIVFRRWLYDRFRTPAAEFDGSGSLVNRLVGSEYLIRGATTYRIVKDQRGSPRLIVDVASGAVAQRMSFDEWGRVTMDTAPGFQPLGFGGGLYDSDTGLVRFGARDYDPDTGRWIAPDPIRFGGGTPNLFEYAGSDPINSSDPSGFQGNAAPIPAPTPPPTPVEVPMTPLSPPQALLCALATGYGIGQKIDKAFPGAGDAAAATVLGAPDNSASGATILPFPLTPLTQPSDCLDGLCPAGGGDGPTDQICTLKGFGPDRQLSRNVWIFTCLYICPDGSERTTLPGKNALCPRTRAFPYPPT